MFPSLHAALQRDGVYPPSRPSAPVSRDHGVTSRCWLARRHPRPIAPPAACLRPSSVRASRLRPAVACLTAHVNHYVLLREPCPWLQIHNPIIIYRFVSIVMPSADLCFADVMFHTFFNVAHLIRQQMDGWIATRIIALTPSVPKKCYGYTFGELWSSNPWDLVAYLHGWWLQGGQYTLCAG